MITSTTNTLVRKLTYHPRTQQLVVYYHSGEIKSFNNVSAETYHELCDAMREKGSAVDPATYLTCRPLNTPQSLAQRRAEHNKRVLAAYGLKAKGERP